MQSPSIVGRSRSGKGPASPSLLLLGSKDSLERLRGMIRPLPARLRRKRRRIEDSAWNSSSELVFEPPQQLTAPFFVEGPSIESPYALAMQFRPLTNAAGDFGEVHVIGPLHRLPGPRNVGQSRHLVRYGSAQPKTARLLIP